MRPTFKKVSVKAEFEVMLTDTAKRRRRGRPPKSANAGKGEKIKIFFSASSPFGELPRRKLESSTRKSENGKEPEVALIDWGEESDEEKTIVDGASKESSPKNNSVSDALRAEIYALRSANNKLREKIDERQEGATAQIREWKKEKTEWEIEKIMLKKKIEDLKKNSTCKCVEDKSKGQSPRESSSWGASSSMKEMARIENKTGMSCSNRRVISELDVDKFVHEERIRFDEKPPPIDEQFLRYEIRERKQRRNRITIRYNNKEKIEEEKLMHELDRKLGLRRFIYRQKMMRENLLGIEFDCLDAKLKVMYSVREVTIQKWLRADAKRLKEKGMETKVGYQRLFYNGETMRFNEKTAELQKFFRRERGNNNRNERVWGEGGPREYAHGG